MKTAEPFSKGLFSAKSSQSKTPNAKTSIILVRGMEGFFHCSGGMFVSEPGTDVFSSCEEVENSFQRAKPKSEILKKNWKMFRLDRGKIYSAAKIASETRSCSLIACATPPSEFKYTISNRMSNNQEFIYKYFCKHLQVVWLADKFFITWFVSVKATWLEIFELCKLIRQLNIHLHNEAFKWISVF